MEDQAGEGRGKGGKEKKTPEFHGCSVQGGREGGRGPGSTAPPKPMQAPTSLLGKSPLQQKPYNLRQIPVTLSKKLSPPWRGRDGSELLRCRLQRVKVGGGDPGERPLLWLFCPQSLPPTSDSFFCHCSQVLCPLPSLPFVSPKKNG